MQEVPPNPGCLKYMLKASPRTPHLLVGQLFLTESIYLLVRLLCRFNQVKVNTLWKDLVYQILWDEEVCFMFQRKARSP
jgi:hypothetical protein